MFSGPESRLWHLLGGAIVPSLAEKVLFVECEAVLGV